jgi:hypothetical protein
MDQGQGLAAQTYISDRSFKKVLSYYGTFLPLSRCPAIGFETALDRDREHAASRAMQRTSTEQNR